MSASTNVLSDVDHKSCDLEGYGTRSPSVNGFGHPGGVLNRNIVDNGMAPPPNGAFPLHTQTPSLRKFANPAPMGLCAFALTIFVLSLVNANARSVQIPSIIISLSYIYAGLVQLLAGMWEMALGNTLGATAFSSYGAFWISFAMIETDGLGIVSAYDGHPDQLLAALGFYLLAWFIFTTILLFCTLKSTLANFSMFFLLDVTFLLLTIAYFNTVDGAVNLPVQKAAGIVGIITSFTAWWNALAGIADESNSFFTIPVFPFPWSEKARADRRGHRSD